MDNCLLDKNFDDLELVLSHLKQFLKSGGSNRKWIDVRGKYSVTYFGTFRRYGKMVEGRGTRELPLLDKMLRDLVKKYDPAFEYNRFQINYNVECKPHKDGQNIGKSLIFSVGKYTGGRLIVDGNPIDIYRKPFLLDGSKYDHWVEPFDGDRFSIIYYLDKKSII